MRATVKLTTPQKRLLEGIVSGHERHCVESYPPLKKLLALALIEKKERGISEWYEPTDAGRRALATDGSAAA